MGFQQEICHAIRHTFIDSRISSARNRFQYRAITDEGYLNAYSNQQISATSLHNEGDYDVR